MNNLQGGHAAQCVATVGLAVVDHVYMLDHIPTQAEKHFATAQQDVVGGIAANAALAIVALGGRSKLFTRVGDDSAGRLVVDDLNASGVEVDCLETIEGQKTASSAVLVDRNGERMIVNHKPDELFKTSPRSIDLQSKNIGTVLGDLRWISGTETIFAAAREMNLPTVLDFDLAPDKVSADILKNTSHIVFAESALQEFTGNIDLFAALLEVHAEHPNIAVAVTAGADGVLYVNKNGQVDHIESRPVRVVSTLGAGDIFHGAVALSLMEGDSFAEALKFANDVAAVKVSKPAHETTLPTRSEVEELQRKYQ